MDLGTEQWGVEVLSNQLEERITIASWWIYHAITVATVSPLIMMWQTFRSALRGVLGQKQSGGCSLILDLTAPQVPGLDNPALGLVDVFFCSDMLDAHAYTVFGEDNVLLLHPL